MSGFREIHSHFVYGVDDGAATRSAMEAMLDAAHEQGVTLLIATPHVTPGMYRFDGALFERHLSAAREYCDSRNYPMQLVAGAEIMYTPAIEYYFKEGEIPTLGESAYILMEFVPDVAYDELEKAVSLAQRTGYRPILAHIERYECMYRKDNAYRLKKKHRVLYQVNSNTVIESRGFFKDLRIRKWFKDELIDFVASDAHDLSRRPFRIREAYQALCERYGKAYAEELTRAEE